MRGPLTRCETFSKTAPRTQGFTLIEMVAVIVVTGIIAAVVAVFIARPVEGYVDASRRAILSDLADTSLRRMGRDIRLAVPNSVRVSGTGGVNSSYLEFIPTSDGVRYRAEQAAGAGNILDFTTTGLDRSVGLTGGFDVYSVSAVTATSGDYLVIFNTGQCEPAGCASNVCTLSGGANAYQGCNRRTISGVTAAGVPGISFVATALPLPFDSPGHRVNIVPASGPVSYACEGSGLSAQGNGKGVLRRYEGYANGAGNWSAGAQPTVFGAGVVSTPLAENVSACTFTYTPGTQTSGLVTLSITLTQANESVTLYHEVHVDNQP